MKKTLLFAVTMLGCVGGAAYADVINGGSVTLTGTVEGSIILTFHQNTSGGIQLQDGDGAASAATDLTTVSMYGTPNGTVLASSNL